ncbi:hypothetical protein [Lignipirellula cremea]|uniref:DUF4303 domain-containing protein n=1 Tax=Lignipirellula cremea TaxID=2528010 RepID=A0A518DLT9_9BACT|nr:hypothetical protein [Lignipirellula cremea]QDU92807.1 hypothetical protein Pla8534_05800 [Lignipirellula cremea]
MVMNINKWTGTLAKLTAQSLHDFREESGDEPMAIFVIDCLPWDGFLALSFLTQKERDELPGEVSMDEMESWRHYNFNEEMDRWTSESGDWLVETMAEAWEEAEDDVRDETGKEFLRACVAAAKSPIVQKALEAFPLSPSFHISVTHADTKEEFYS